MSDNFTKMVNNKWIQDGWELKVGDWTDFGLVCHIDWDTKDVKIRSMHERSANWFAKKTVIWLPTIEQLMGMLNKRSYKIYYYWDSGYTVLIEYPFQSYKSDLLEIALIQVVMHELHGKKRDGERWAK